MKCWRALTVAAALILPLPGWSCPNCKDAVAFVEDDDPLREARAYNRSIYLMVGMPYALVGLCGFAGYRLYRSARRTEPPAQS